MGKITKTFSIENDMYLKFENICKSKKLNKSKILQKCIFNFIIDNFDIEDKFFVMKNDDEYNPVTISKKDDDMLHLSDGNILNFMTFEKIYQETDPGVKKTKDYIDKMNGYSNLNENDLDDIIKKGATSEEFEEMVKAGEKLKDDFDKPFIDPNELEKFFESTSTKMSPEKIKSEFDKTKIYDKLPSADDILNFIKTSTLDKEVEKHWGEDTIKEVEQINPNEFCGKPFIDPKDISTIMKTEIIDKKTDETILTILNDNMNIFKDMMNNSSNIDITDIFGIGYKVLRTFGNNVYIFGDVSDVVQGKLRELDEYCKILYVTNFYRSDSYITRNFNNFLYNVDNKIHAKDILYLTETLRNIYEDNDITVNRLGGSDDIIETNIPLKFLYLPETHKIFDLFGFNVYYTELPKKKYKITGRLLDEDNNPISTEIKLIHYGSMFKTHEKSIKSNLTETTNSDKDGIFNYYFNEDYDMLNINKTEIAFYKYIPTHELKMVTRETKEITFGDLIIQTEDKEKSIEN